MMRKIWKKILIATAGSSILLAIALLIIGVRSPTSVPIPVRSGEFEDSIPQERVRELISSALSEEMRVGGAKVPFEVTHESDCR